MTYRACRISQTTFILRLDDMRFSAFSALDPWNPRPLSSLNMNFLTWNEQVCFKYQRAEVAQSVEQGTENPRVGGSIPSLGTSIPGACSLSRPFFTEHPKDDRCARTSVRPKESVTYSDASRFFSHVLRPSPEGTDIPRLTVFYCLLLRTSNCFPLEYCFVVPTELSLTVSRYRQNWRTRF